MTLLKCQQPGDQIFSNGHLHFNHSVPSDPVFQISCQAVYQAMCPGLELWTHDHQLETEEKVGHSFLFKLKRKLFITKTTSCRQHDQKYYWKKNSPLNQTYQGIKMFSFSIVPFATPNLWNICDHSIFLKSQCQGCVSSQTCPLPPSIPKLLQDL